MLHKPVLSLSRFFKQHRQAYYEHLQAVRDSGAWEEWLAFFLRGVIAVATEAAGNGHQRERTFAGARHAGRHRSQPVAAEDACRRRRDDEFVSREKQNRKN